MLRFDIAPDLEDTGQVGMGTIPVFGSREAVHAPQEAPVEVILSFAEDIVPFALDSNLMAEWVFSVRTERKKEIAEEWTSDK